MLRTFHDAQIAQAECAVHHPRKGMPRMTLGEGVKTVGEDGNPAFAQCARQLRGKTHGVFHMFQDILGHDRVVMPVSKFGHEIHAGFLPDSLDARKRGKAR